MTADRAAPPFSRHQIVFPHFFQTVVTSRGQGGGRLLVNKCRNVSLRENDIAF
jgi:hypothetical protein